MGPGSGRTRSRRSPSPPLGFAAVVNPCCLELLQPSDRDNQRLVRDRESICYRMHRAMLDACQRTERSPSLSQSAFWPCQPRCCTLARAEVVIDRRSPLCDALLPLVSSPSCLELPSSTESCLHQHRSSRNDTSLIYW